MASDIIQVFAMPVVVDISGHGVAWVVGSFGRGVRPLCEGRGAQLFVR